MIGIDGPTLGVALGCFGDSGIVVAAVPIDKRVERGL
jgi:hypothetical protein